jgi:hypothetical protein
MNCRICKRPNRFINRPGQIMGRLSLLMITKINSLLKVLKVLRAWKKSSSTGKISKTILKCYSAKARPSFRTHSGAEEVSHSISSRISLFPNHQFPSIRNRQWSLKHTYTRNWSTFKTISL